MSSVKKPQKLFLMRLFSVLRLFQGKATFRNLSRYSDMHEKRFSRWSRRAFDFAHFNARLLAHELPKDHERIAAIDASFMKKSGKHTEGLGYFYHSQAGKAEKGLEISLISLIDLDANTGYAIDARQTVDVEEQSRVDLYARHFREVAPALKKASIRYLAADSYYSKVKFIDAVCEEAFDLVGKLRIDADLYWLYPGDYKGCGRPKKYDGKVDIVSEKTRFDSHLTLEDGIDLYSQVVYCKRFKRNLRVVLLHARQKGKEGHALLFSTDAALDPVKILNCYKARFQIEFLFRDAKQYTGLMDCQARCKEAIQMQANASLTALNLLKLEDRRQKQTTQETVISIASWKRKKFNQHLMLRLFDKLGLSRDCEKIAQLFDEFSDYGTIAA
jgi:hypothetical protein